MQVVCRDNLRSWVRGMVNQRCLVCRSALELGISPLHPMTRYPSRNFSERSLGRTQCDIMIQSIAANRAASQRLFMTPNPTWELDAQKANTYFTFKFKPKHGML